MFLSHLCHGGAFGKERTGGTDLHTFTTTGATVTGAPRLVKIGNYQAVDAPAHNIPCMCAFHFVTDTHTAGAKDATVVIQHKALMAGVHGQVRVQIIVAHMVHAHSCGLPLQFTVAVHHTNRTDVVAFGKE